MRIKELIHLNTYLGKDRIHLRYLLPTCQFNDCLTPPPNNQFNILLDLSPLPKQIILNHSYINNICNSYPNLLFLNNKNVNICIYAIYLNCLFGV